MEDWEGRWAGVSCPGVLKALSLKVYDGEESEENKEVMAGGADSGQ